MVVDPEKNDVVRFLRMNPVLAKLSDAALMRIASTTVVQRRPRKESFTIPKDHFVLIGFGLVKSEFLSPLFIDALCGPGETIDFANSTTGLTSRTRRCVVITDHAMLVALNGPTVLGELSHAGLMQHLLRDCNIMANRTTERLLSSFHATAEARLAQVLTDLLERFGDEREDGSSFISLRMSRGDLSSLSGSTVETIIRILGAWKKASLVTSDENGFEILDRVKLRLLGVT